MLLDHMIAEPMTDLHVQVASIRIQAGSDLSLSGSISLLRLDNACTGSECKVTHMNLI